MSKAEDRALEQYPAEIYKRKYFIEGYQQAEKDLELTWEDVEKIVDLFDDVYCDFSIGGKGGKTNTEEHYQEVLKRFQERKEVE